MMVSLVPRPHPLTYKEKGLVTIKLLYDVIIFENTKESSHHVGVQGATWWSCSQTTFVMSAQRKQSGRKTNLYGDLGV